MTVRIGFLGDRTDLAVEVASVAMRSGAIVLPGVQHAAGLRAGAAEVGREVDLLLADVDALNDDGPQASTTVAGAAAVICRPDEAARATLAADRLGFRHVVELPTGAAWLEAQVAPPSPSGLVGVLGALGGVGATTAAIACAVGAGRQCLLVDADPHSPGLDLPLGIPEHDGVRWAQIPDAFAPLDAGSLRSALPRVAGCCVVTGPLVPGPPAWGRGPSVGQYSGVLGVGRSQFERTVVDLGRGRDPGELLGPGDAAALVVPATLAGVVAARSALQRLPARRIVVLVRPSAWLSAGEVAEQLGVDDVVVVPHLRRAVELCDCGDLLSGRTGRRLRLLGQRVWERLE